MTKSLLMSDIMLCFGNSTSKLQLEISLLHVRINHSRSSVSNSNKVSFNLKLNFEHCVRCLRAFDKNLNKNFKSLERTIL